MLKLVKKSRFGGDSMPDDISDYKREYEKEQERLAKLWDAYELQEKDFEQSKEKIRVLEDVIEADQYKTYRIYQKELQG